MPPPPGASLLAILAPILLALLLEAPIASSSVLIGGNSTIASDNGTFELGFFSPNGGSSWYLGIWYASTPTYVWVANRANPVRNLASATFEITATGQLVVTELGNSVLWQSGNEEAEAVEEVKLLDSGNLLLLSEDGRIVWQTFDYPSDTWLPGMNLTKDRPLVSWRSFSDPSPGFYSLRLKPPVYGQFELVFNSSSATSYWATGNWTGDAFSAVPEMTIPYIYRFYFDKPFTRNASFGYSETSLDSALKPPPTRFQVDPDGQLRQYTWSSQIGSWNTFWSQPEKQCHVYGLCGNLGLCSTAILRPCQCLSGFRPVDEDGWTAGDYSNGCRRKTELLCESSDVFEEVGVVAFEGGIIRSETESRDRCEKLCLGNCSCVGFSHDSRIDSCKNIFGPILSLRNSSSDPPFFVRVERRSGVVKKNISKTMVWVGSVVGAIAALGLSVLTVMVVKSRRRKEQDDDEGCGFPMMNLRVFTYKELQTSTKGFSEKLGHGGFGAVFRGQLPDSTVIAVKRLERQGGGEKEFRAEVRTIGNIHHVNLVRLRGFCSDNLHRLLVYDYMPNGPLSAYLGRDSPNLGWEVRFQIGIDTARGLAYLHEECRDCIIHCDIKPENILIDGNFAAKVSDFGLAKLIGRDFSRVLATMRGTWGYVAPEWISGVGITTKADVYSFGMTLLELIGGRRNVEGPPNSEARDGGGSRWFFPPWAAQRIVEGHVAAVVDERLGGAYNREELERVAAVAVWCIQDEEGARPTMGLVVKMLEGVVEVPPPPPPKLIQALVSGESFQGFTGDFGVSENNREDPQLPSKSPGGSDSSQG